MYIYVCVCVCFQWVYLDSLLSKATFKCFYHMTHVTFYIIIALCYKSCIVLFCLNDQFSFTQIFKMAGKLVCVQLQCSSFLSVDSYFHLILMFLLMKSAMTDF